MCNNPIDTKNGPLACGRCNDCIAAKINTWSGRAVAEKTTSAFTYALTLTYANNTQEQRDGATVFRYKDVKNLMKIIRFNGDKRWPEFKLSYIVCGEFGAKKGRVHWHALFFASHDILSIGNFLSFVTKQEITERQKKITIDPVKAPIRINWGHWPWGFVMFQEPDAGGVNYVLKYAFKDQFNIVKSKGTARELTAENYSAGFFRMSKKPPIGERWVNDLLRRLAVSGSVLPTLKLRTEGFKGHWVPHGYMRDKLLDGFRAINQASLDYTGLPVPQWNTLLHNVADQTSVLERLSRGEKNEENEWAELRSAIATRTRERDASKQNREIRERCGGAFPCTTCSRGLSAATFERTYSAIARAAFAAGGIAEYERELRKTRTCNFACQLAHTPRVLQSFISFA
jgi:hypothetical protein